MILYKYCRPERLDILRFGDDSLARPRVFNDPFELQPNISKFDDPGEMIHHLLDRTNSVVVLSLAENCQSLLMWAHYTESYRGFLIGFEDPANYILTHPSPHRDYGPVFYCHHRPRRPRFADVPNHELFYTKSSDWSYEREWRIIDSLYSADGPAFADNENCWPFNINSDSVKFVIVGYGSQNISEIITILREPGYEHTRLIMAIPDHQRFELLFLEFDRNNGTVCRLASPARARDGSPTRTATSASWMGRRIDKGLTK